MSTFKLTDKGGTDFDPIPAETHQAVCYGVVDIGTQKSHNPQHGAKRKLVLLFELPHCRADFGERKNQPRAISITLTASLNQKAVLRAMLESWRGRKFTPLELEGFDPKVLIGVNCMLGVIHEDKGDKTYANIKSISKLMAQIPSVKQENPPLYFTLEGADLLNLTFPQNMPQWIQKKITFCEEVMEATGSGPARENLTYGDQSGHQAQHEADVAAHAAGKPVNQKPAVPPPAAQENLDEDVPF